jgi:2-dehydropantoate 2-reductase
MKIGIIGAGSIGLLFAAYLSKTYQVIVYTRKVEQAAAINENGVIVVKNGCETRHDIRACHIDMWHGKEDLIIVAVKQYQMEEIIDKIGQTVHSPSNILFLQNGMSHLKLLPRLSGNNIFVGSVEQGALKENFYTVRHNGEGVTNLALFSGDCTNLTVFSAAVPANFPVCIHENYYDMLLSKLIINSVINPLTATLQVQNGELVKNEYYYKVLKDLFFEIAFTLDLDDPDVYFQRLIDVCQKTALNRSSMLKDLEMGRKTEVDAILGYVLNVAREQKKKAPILESLYHLVKGKESMLK